MVKLRAMVTRSKTKEGSKARQDNTTVYKHRDTDRRPEPHTYLLSLFSRSPVSSNFSSGFFSFCSFSCSFSCSSTCQQFSHPPADGQLPYLCLPRPISNLTCAPKTPRSNLPPQITNSQTSSPSSSPYSSYPLLTASGAPTTPKILKGAVGQFKISLRQTCHDILTNA